jgi:proliferating cell nuclear antigen
MRLKTIQASAIKSVFEVLKDIINDVNVYFTPEGVRIVTLDTARVTLIHMTLEAENFEEYACPENVSAGLNMINVYKLLKSITAQDTLTLEISGRDAMDILIENTTKKSSTSFRLKLLDINEDVLTPPKIPMDTVTTLSSVDFQRIVRDMNNLATDMFIERRGTVLELSCHGDFADQKTLIQFPDSAGPTGNVFSLKYINLFIKATNMCSSVQLLQSMTHTNLIVFRYTIANLGDLKFYLAARSDI